jgi:pilus assembly protein CpaD
MNSAVNARRAGTALKGIFAAALALGAAGCLREPAVTASGVQDDYRDRHPIYVADAEESMDVYAGGRAGLDHRQREDVIAFAKLYAQRGKGPMTAFVPSHGGHYSLGQVRHALAEAGVASFPLAVRSYATPQGYGGHPIRLVFTRLQARAANRCDTSPQDLLYGGTREGWRNQDYWNLGCAYQHNLAQQVDDPIDLVRGRPETPPDTNRRMSVIEKLRKSEDPSTSWKARPTSINNSLGGF